MIALLAQINRSIGATIIEMAQTKPPWHELPPFSAAYAIGQGTSKPKIPISLSPIARDFIGSAMRRFVYFIFRNL